MMLFKNALKEKTDSWKDVIPIWAKTIYTEGNKTNIGTVVSNKMGDVCNCAVAEVYGMSADYHTDIQSSYRPCDLCTMYASDIPSINLHNIVNIREVDKFVQHVRDVHPNLVKGAI